MERFALQQDVLNQLAELTEVNAHCEHSILTCEIMEECDNDFAALKGRFQTIKNKRDWQGYIDFYLREEQQKLYEMLKKLMKAYVINYDDWYMTG